MFAIDEYPISYPYYHGPGDTVSQLDPTFWAGAARIAGAALVELANQP